MFRNEVVTKSILSEYFQASLEMSFCWDLPSFAECMSLHNRVGSLKPITNVMRVENSRFSVKFSGLDDWAGANGPAQAHINSTNR